jgi:hypothetical protein
MRATPTLGHWLTSGDERHYGAATQVGGWWHHEPIQPPSGQYAMGDSRHAISVVVLCVVLE